jgi:hypothetical protein
VEAVGSTLSRRRAVLLAGLAAVLISGCAQPAPLVDPQTQMTQAVMTAFASIQGTRQASAPIASSTPLPVPTVARTPPALPGAFSTNVLNPRDTPHAYIADACEYLKDKWTSTNAEPGTIVMVVMFHTIEKATSSTSDPKNIGSTDFHKLMNGLHDMGFQAINAAQLADFLDRNAKIPPRSVVLIQDDRHAASNFTDWFLPYWQKWQWPVINGWISALGGGDPVLAENVALEQQGWVDHEAHGVIHNIPMSDSSTDEFITGELEGSVTNIQKYFNKTPIAIVWPGGGFGVRPVQFARKFGYRLGFTINPRGPIMFNWVPLDDQLDPARPYYLPEGPVNDPRMVLPRYWPSQVLPNLDLVRNIADQAATYAQQNKATELDYYSIVCAPKLGPLP